MTLCHVYHDCLLNDEEEEEHCRNVPVREVIGDDLIHLRELRWKMSGTVRSVHIEIQGSAKIRNMHAQAFWHILTVIAHLVP